jgi:hypothetical protein
MKKYYLTLFAAAMLIGCGNENTETTTNDETEVVEKDEYEGLRPFSLEKYDLNLSIMVPQVVDGEDNVIDPQVIHNMGEATWTIVMDKNFHIVIDDWGNEKQTTEMEKKRNDEGFFVYSYEEETPEYLFYSRKLGTNEAGSESGGSFYHFFVVKEINGMYYTVKSNRMSDFYKDKARIMLKAGLSLSLPETQS